MKIKLARVSLRTGLPAPIRGSGQVVTSAAAEIYLDTTERLLVIVPHSHGGEARIYDPSVAEMVPEDGAAFRTAPAEPKGGAPRKVATA